MIPVRLRLRDFLSYVDPEPIDFTGFEVACLTGPNGVGKSSLLDAMTWACWGNARGCEGGQNQDRLIRDGADATSVEFDFELGGDYYRIVRSRSRDGRSDLRFEVRDDAGWTNIAGETLRETESRISERLRMDYRTFVASSFLLQGRADDFLARMRPDERKDVFARLLDLGTYERLEDAARVKAREADVRRARFEAEAQKLRERVAATPEVERELREAECRLADAVAEAKEVEAVLEPLRTEIAALEHAEAEVAKARTDAEQAGSRLEAEREALAALDAEEERVVSLLARGDEVAAAAEEAKQLRAAEADLRARADRRAELEKQRLELGGKLEVWRKESQATVREKTVRADRLEAEGRELAEKAAASAETERRLADLDGTEDQLESVRARLGELRGCDADLKARASALDERLAEIGEKAELLKGGGATCPVCGGELDDTHRKQIRSQLTAERKVVRSEVAEVQRELRKVQAEGKQAVADEQQLIGKVKDAALLVARVAELRAAAQRRDAVCEEAAVLRAEAVAVAEASEAASVEARRALELVEAGLGEHPDVTTQLTRLGERLCELSALVELGGRIAEAEGQRQRLNADRERIQGRITEASDDLEQRQVAVATLEQRTAGAGELRERMSVATTKADEARRAVGDATATQARLGERLESLKRSATDLESAESEERSAAAEHRSFVRLTSVFGRGGVPDRIIENALPELTDDANDVLGRLTDYEMSVAFQMTKETKSGKVRETFDVLVHHDGGVRDFAMFSGGEAFRIAFAIRLGLSKLLVRRAGARLETLVIDEGFGTQDPTGRERIVEAVNLARREFRKVIVITHLDELKDAFGTQLRVSREPGLGSTVDMIND